MTSGTILSAAVSTKLGSLAKLPRLAAIIWNDIRGDFKVERVGFDIIFGLIRLSNLPSDGVWIIICTCIMKIVHKIHKRKRGKTKKQKSKKAKAESATNH